MELGYAVALGHRPDSEPGLQFSEAGKSSPWSSEAEIFPIKKNGYLFCKFVLTLTRKTLSEPFICNNVVKGTRDGTV